MKLHFLGTAAAEGIPALFCTCAVCTRARELGGRELRSRSSALIDNAIKLDFGPDSYWQLMRSGLSYAGLKSVLITHTHADHFTFGELECRQPGFSHLPENAPPMTVYGNETLGEKLAPILCNQLRFCRMVPFVPQEIDGYTVTALEAVHCLDFSGSDRWPVEFEGKTYPRTEEALFYLIEKDGRSILYAHDTDEFSSNDMAFLKGKHLDIVSLDCTNGLEDRDYIGHMGGNDNLRMRRKLIQIGAADENTAFIANHFSHNGCGEIAALEKHMPGFVVAYDGLVLETDPA